MGRTAWLMAARVLVITGMVGSGLPLHAQAPERAGQPAAASRVPVGAAVAPVMEQSAEETREGLRRVLEQYAPSVVEVLRHDPSLLANDGYLATYPALASYLAQHPAVAHNPGFFLGGIRTYDQPRDARTEAVHMWRDFVQSLTIFAGFGLAIGVLVWLIRMLVDSRRWLRLSRIQTEVHTKLLDRLTASEDLAAYMQSSAGKRFLESAPIPMDAGPRAIGAPLGRILFSVQTGVVLACGGFGLLYVSGRVLEEVATGVFAFGVLAIAFGGGFIVSAVIAYFLSQRLGLLEPAARTTE
jgi:hypothetical protein